MQQLIDDFVAQLRQQHKIRAVMVAGSYVTKQMQANSDIDLFCVTEKESLRGRERFFGQAFEYFLSPLEAFEQRLEQNDVSLRIYSTAEPVFDPEDIAAQIITKAQAKRAVFRVDVTQAWKNKQCYKAEERCLDICDLFANRQVAEASILAGVAITDMVDVIRQLHHQLPLYPKYLLRELSAFDEPMAEQIDAFWHQPSAARFQRIYQHLYVALGQPDLSHWQGK